MALRICSGIYGSRRIESPKGIRPTADRVKEALFSALGHTLHGKKVLDCYAGSGALGIEAISRGADSAVFIEQSRECCRIIQRNVENLGITSQTKIIHSDARAFVQNASSSKYDLILIDPPYNKGLASGLAPHVYELVELGGVLVIEHTPDEIIPLEPWKTKVYGGTKITFVKKEKA